MSSVEIAHAPGMSRRELIKGGVALGAALTVGGVATQDRRAQALPGQRIGVIGGGMAGLETAWLLDGTHTVTLLEKDAVIGGHAQTVTITVGGAARKVDVGAQYFAQQNYPNFWKLVNTTLGVPVVTANMSIAVWQYGSSSLEFFSPDPFSNFVNAMSMLAFTTAAQADWAGSDRRGTGNWNTTLQSYVNSLWIAQSSKDNFLYPFLAALNGTSTSQNKTVAARGGVAFLARPTTVINYQPYPYQNVRDGLKAVADAMLAQMTTTNVHTSTEVVGLAKVGNEYVVTDANSQQYTFDQIVLALPPYPAKALVNQLGAGGAAIKAIYDQQEYFHATTAIHTNPDYMHPNTSKWASYNARNDGDYCEACMWYGAIQDQVAGLPIFKSWTTHRREAPTGVLATADYWHPNITPAFINAQIGLNAIQGQNGIWFAGTHTYDVDSQESALVSACKVAQGLAPGSARLTALNPNIKVIW
jgi:predicted NAD/FAD-binding protein